jgi:putative transposase
MKKLNQRKIRWILREAKKGEHTVCGMARLQNITPRHARRVIAKYANEKRPRLLACGRKPKPITPKEVKAVLRVRKTHPVMGACSIQLVLDEQHQHIPHNRVHQILKQQGLSIEQPAKQKRRKWIRFEREHSNSLWHIDYSELDGKQVLGLIDDASRLVPWSEEFDEATAENAVVAFDKAVAKYGPPSQVLSDNGSHFASVIRQSCPDPERNVFQKRLDELGVQHIKTRVHHPQTNGKMERWFETLAQLKPHFKTIRRCVNYYNNKRPNMSLYDGRLKTPAKAYKEKLKGGTA